MAALLAPGLVPGAATAVGAVVHDRVVAADPVDTTPHALDGEVLALAQVGDHIVVGGSFTTIRNASQSARIARPYLFAFDRRTGRIDPAFAPVLDAPVRTLADAGDGTILVGGGFTTVNETPRRYLARLRVADGTLVDAFRPGPNATVEDVVVHGGLAYVGGSFTRIGRAVRSRLAAVDLASGLASPGLAVPVGGLPNDKVKALDVSPDGSTLVIAGAFLTVGRFQRVQVAMIDLATQPARLATWRHNSFGIVRSPGFSCVKDVDFSPDGTYFVFAAQCAGPYIGDALSRFETDGRGDVEPTWVNWTGHDSLWSATVTGEAIYAGGHQRSMNGGPEGLSDTGATVPREGIAAVDPVNGVALTWNPGRSRGQGVFAMLATDDMLYVGSDTERLGGEWHARLGGFPLAGGAALSMPLRVRLPATLHQTTPQAMVTRSLDKAAVGAGTAVPNDLDWSGVRGTWGAGGGMYWVAGDGHVHRRSFDGTTFGADVDLNIATGMNAPGWTPLERIRGAAWAGGWLYYTLENDSNLYRRGFSLESDLMSTVAKVVSGPGVDGIDWRSTRGLAIAGRYVFSAHDDGTLERRGFAGGLPVARTALTVSGPAVDGRDWSTTTGLFVR